MRGTAANSDVVKRRSPGRFSGGGGRFYGPVVRADSSGRLGRFNAVAGGGEKLNEAGWTREGDR